jgi:hypothetical protein
LQGETFAGLDQPSPGGGKPLVNVLGGPVEDIPLLREDQPTGMAVEERDLELTLHTLDLPADGRLAEPQTIASPCEAARLGDCIEDPHLVPIQRAFQIAQGERRCSEPT